MGRDKAALEVGGESALERAVRLLAPRCQDVFVSVRAGQDDALRARHACIADRHGSVGPVDGIGSAQAERPDAAWLVLACDLPRLDAATLDALIAQRDEDKYATAYTSACDALPEPLCAIWEPRSAAAVRAALAADRRCARKILIGLDAALLPPATGDALDNANTPEDWARIRGAGA